jgi:hypothetical protein
MTCTTEERAADLEEIFADGNLVFLDACADGTSREGPSFSWRTYDAETYGTIDPQVIQEELKRLQFFRGLFGNANAWTTKEVFTEKRAFLGQLGEKISYLDRNESRKRARSHGEGEGSTSEDLLKRLHDETVELCNAMKSRSIIRNDELLIEPRSYQAILQTVELIQDYFHLKHQSKGDYADRKLDNDGIPVKKGEGSRTDEKLVALGFYTSMFSRFRPVILSSDGDMHRLVNVCSHIIGSSEFFPFNADFAKAIGYNPLRLYGRWDGAVQRTLDSSDIPLSERFVVKGNGRIPIRTQVTNLLDTINSKLIWGN